MMLVTLPRWPPCPYMVKTLQKSSSPEPASRFPQNLICSVVGCPLIRLLPSDVNAKVCMYTYKCKGTDLRTLGSRNLIHTQTSTALRTDGRTDKRTNPKPTRRLGCHHTQADVTPMNRIGKVRISGYKLVVCGEQSQ